MSLSEAQSAVSFEELKKKITFPFAQRRIAIDKVYVHREIVVKKKERKNKRACLLIDSIRHSKLNKIEYKLW